MQIPKLVVFDVDGTLLDHEGRCRPRTRAAVDRLRKNEVAVAVATGRPQAVADETLDLIGGADWIVCGNGSSLFETATGTFLRNSFLPDDVIAPLVIELRDRLPGVGFALELHTTLLEEPGFAQRVPESSPQPVVHDVLEALSATPVPVRRIIPFHDDYDDSLGDLAAIVSEFLDDRCQVRFGGLALVDISPAGGHKAVALQALVDHLEIEVHEVIAFGDGGNDIEMLKWAGIGVAMGNAHPHVHLAADVITDRNDGGGVAVFLEPMLDHLETIQ